MSKKSSKKSMKMFLDTPLLEMADDVETRNIVKYKFEGVSVDKAIKMLDDFELNGSITLTEESFNRVLEMIENPPEPTEELKKLMSSGV